MATREPRPRSFYAYVQLVVSVILVSLGDSVASRVHVFQASSAVWERGPHSLLQVVYYGAVGQTAYGSMVVIASFVPSVVRSFTWPLAEYAHLAYNKVKVSVSTREGGRKGISEQTQWRTVISKVQERRGRTQYHQRDPTVEAIQLLEKLGYFAI